jgi:hypothetical protein
LQEQKAGIALKPKIDETEANSKVKNIRDL